MYKNNKDEMNIIVDQVKDSILLGEHSEIKDVDKLIEYFYQVKERIEFIKKDIVPKQILDKVVIEVEDYVQPLPVQYKPSLFENIKSFFATLFQKNTSSNLVAQRVRK